MAKRVVNLDSTDDETRHDWYRERDMRAFMMPERRGGRRLRVSPDTFNVALISRSPGCSTNTGLDFVKAVYSERTGQE